MTGDGSPDEGQDDGDDGSSGFQFERDGESDFQFGDDDATGGGDADGSAGAAEDPGPDGGAEDPGPDGGAASEGQRGGSPGDDERPRAEFDAGASEESVTFEVGGGTREPRDATEPPHEEDDEPEEPYVEFHFDDDQTPEADDGGTSPDGPGSGGTGSDDRSGPGTEESSDGRTKSRLELERELQEMTLEEQFEDETEAAADRQDDERDDPDERGEADGSARTAGQSETEEPRVNDGDAEGDGSETDPGLALVLSFLLPGVGNLYSGQSTRGAVWLVAWLAWLVVGWGAGGFIFGILLGLATYGLMFVLTFLVLVVMELVIHAVAAYDGYNQARKIDDGAVQV